MNTADVFGYILIVMYGLAVLLFGYKIGKKEGQMIQVKPLSDVLQIVEQFRQDKNPPYKEYENTYMDGWLDACNEIYWAIEERILGK